MHLAQKRGILFIEQWHYITIVKYSYLLVFLLIDACAVVASSAYFHNFRFPIPFCFDSKKPLVPVSKISFGQPKSHF